MRNARVQSAVAFAFAVLWWLERARGSPGSHRYTVAAVARGASASEGQRVVSSLEGALAATRNRTGKAGAGDAWAAGKPLLSPPPLICSTRCERMGAMRIIIVCVTHHYITRPPLP
jgi:hypothetical protein